MSHLPYQFFGKLQAQIKALSFSLFRIRANGEKSQGPWNYWVTISFSNSLARLYRGLVFQGYFPLWYHCLGKGPSRILRAFDLRGGTSVCVCGGGGARGMMGGLKVGGFERTSDRFQKEPHFKRTAKPGTWVSGESHRWGTSPSGLAQMLFTLLTTARGMPTS